MQKRLDNFIKDSSGWVVCTISYVALEIARFEPFQPRSFIPLPKTLALKKAIINIQNDDQMCFVYSVLAALYPIERNPQRVTKYLPYLDTTDISDLTFPVTIDQISVFEQKIIYQLMF